MSTRCIACKREISDKQKSCYICGSSQNYIAYFSKSLIVIAIAFIGAFWLSYNLFERDLEAVKSSQIKNSKHASEQFSLIQAELENKIILLDKSKKETDLEIERLKASISLGSENSSDTQKILEKEKSRSRWLSKENRKFSDKIKKLTIQIARLEEKTKTNPSNKAAEKVIPLVDVILSNDDSLIEENSPNKDSAVIESDVIENDGI